MQRNVALQRLINAKSRKNFSESYIFEKESIQIRVFIKLRLLYENGVILFMWLQCTYRTCYELRKGFPL